MPNGPRLVGQVVRGRYGAALLAGIAVAVATHTIVNTVERLRAYTQEIRWLRGRLVDKRELVTLMTLGHAPEALAIGFLRNQRLVDSIRNIASVQVDWETESVAVVTKKIQKDIEKKIRADIDADVEKIKQDPEPSPEDLYTNVGIGKHYIRGINHPELSQLEY